MKQTFVVKSSSGTGSYLVEFLFDEETLSIHCNCQAGGLGKLCKHKIGLLKGDQSLLTSSDQLRTLNEILIWANQTGYPELLKELNLAEIELENAQSKISSIKKVIEKAMRNGA